MFNRIEHIANSAGKFLLQCLFIVAVFINCIACAKYILSKKQNFQCPLCSYFKELRNPVFKISLKELGIIALPTYEYETKINSISSEEHIDIVKDEVIVIPNQNHWNEVPKERKRQLQFYHSNILVSTKLYLLYHQLKVGDDTLIA